jgi:hypothetical protein
MGDMNAKLEVAFLHLLYLLSYKSDDKYLIIEYSNIVSLFLGEVMT